MAQTPVRPWRVERQRYLYRDRWLTHRADRCVTERGEVLDPFHVFEFTDWVNVIALTADRRVLLVDEYRHGVGELVRGLPSGVMETDETDPATSVARELLEETGHRAEQMWPVAESFANAASQTNRVWSFLAINCRPVGDTRFDPGENIALAPVALADCLRDLHAGRLRMQMAHLLGLFATESFLRGGDDPSFAEIRLALA
ncbi:MAG: NUDIX hydrolase [Pseudomonadota bacterium]|nr:NUDIX hydrolase [Pseudomonadota bacterium]